MNSYYTITIAFFHIDLSYNKEARNLAQGAGSAITDNGYTFYIKGIN